jgi:hypothetical protein
MLFIIMEEKVFKSRGDPRIQTLVKVAFKTDNSSDAMEEGIITNFSRSGLFIEASTILSVNSHIIINVFLPDEKIPLLLVGEVRNVVESESGEGGMGIKIFEDRISDEEKERLEEFFDLNHIYGWFC